MSVTQDYLVKLAARFDEGHRIDEIMREDELVAGFTPVLAGSVHWLPLSDWPHHVVVSTDGTIVRLVAILANHPGTGAFTRLVAAIQRAGLVPVVVAPSREMRAILKRWRWRCKHTGRGFTAEETWRPRSAKLTKDTPNA